MKAKRRVCRSKWGPALAKVERIEINLGKGMVLCGVLVTQSGPTLWRHGLYPARLLHLWDCPSKSTGVGCHFLLHRKSYGSRQVGAVVPSSGKPSWPQCDIPSPILPLISVTEKWGAAAHFPGSALLRECPPPCHKWGLLWSTLPAWLHTDHKDVRGEPVKVLTPIMWPHSTVTRAPTLQEAWVTSELTVWVLRSLTEQHFFFLRLATLFYNFIYLFICGCAGSSLLRLFLSGGGRRLLSAHSVRTSHCGGFSCCGAWALGPVGSEVTVPGLQSIGSVVVARGLRCSWACRVFPYQGLNPCLSCLVHLQVDSLPLSHQGRPKQDW